jgi:hypothetical protein
MIRILLSTVIVATQLLSWNASPRYLCRSVDGSVCVDLGPAACDCCRHEIVLAEGPHGHGACPDDCDRAGDDCDRPGDAQFDPCGCTHVQLSEAHCARHERATTVPDSHRLVISLPPAARGDHAGWLAASRAAAPPWHLPNALAQSLAERAGVVMRC